MSEDFTLQTIDELMAAARSSDIKPDHGRYYMTISSRPFALLVMIVAKERWKAEYRLQRIARRDNG